MSAHNSSISTLLPDSFLSVPRKAPVVGLKALMFPSSAKLPTRSAPPKMPNEEGAITRPHGESSTPPLLTLGDTNEVSLTPSVLNLRTKPSPGASTLSPVIGLIFA